MCRSRNPGSDKSEPTIKITYRQHILSFHTFPINILPHLTHWHRYCDMCSINSSYCIVEERSIVNFFKAQWKFLS
jgi:hypothetical protein